MSKKNPKHYADELRGVRPDNVPALQPEDVSAPEDVSPEELGLEVFDPTTSGDIIEWNPAVRQELQRSGYTMVERYLTIPPGGGVRAFFLGWSATVLPAVDDKTKLRYLRRMHLELVSGARVSHLEAAQLAPVFALPCDGSASVTIYRGGETIRNGRRQGQWETWVALGARKPTHDAGKSYAQVAGEAMLVQLLGGMTHAELLRIDGAPPGLLEPYIALARERELDAEITKRSGGKA